MLRHLKHVEYNFHVRAFGEEMPRVNSLSLAKRRHYVAEMVDHADYSVTVQTVMAGA